MQNMVTIVHSIVSYTWNVLRKKIIKCSHQKINSETITRNMVADLLLFCSFGKPYLKFYAFFNSSLLFLISTWCRNTCILQISLHSLLFSLISTGIFST
jgi:hypothetical protein